MAALGQCWHMVGAAMSDLLPGLQRSWQLLCLVLRPQSPEEGLRHVESYVAKTRSSEYRQRPSSTGTWCTSDTIFSKMATFAVVLCPVTMGHRPWGSSGVFHGLMLVYLLRVSLLKIIVFLFFTMGWYLVPERLVCVLHPPSFCWIFLMSFGLLTFLLCLLYFLIIAALPRYSVACICLATKQSNRASLSPLESDLFFFDASLRWYVWLSGIAIFF